MDVEVRFAQRDSRPISGLAEAGETTTCTNISDRCVLQALFGRRADEPRYETHSSEPVGLGTEATVRTGAQATGDRTISR